MGVPALITGGLGGPPKFLLTGGLGAFSSVTPITAALQLTAPGPYVVMYELDLTARGGTIQRFTPMVNNPGGGGSMTPLMFDGNAYQPIPIIAKGFEKSAKGQLARPTLSIGNVTNIGTQLLRDFDGLRGVPLTRIRTLAQYLDGGATPDPGQVLPREEYIIARKTQHNRLLVEFELRAAIDIEGVVIPKRVLLRQCSARYRVWNETLGDFVVSESDMACPYAGDDFWDSTDLPTADPGLDRCSKSIRGCQARFGERAVLPFMGFPGAARAR